MLKSSDMRITITPNEENHTIELDKAWYGKELEIEIKEKSIKEKPQLPPSNPIDAKILLKNAGLGKDFPTIEELRKRTAPDKWNL
jgi:hypothetical protein